MFAYLISPIYMVILLGYLVVWMQSRRWYSSIYFLYFLFIYLFRIGEYFARVKPLVNEILLTIKLQKEFQEFTDDELRAELRVCQIMQKEDPNFENRVRIKLLKIMLEEGCPTESSPDPTAAARLALETSSNSRKTSLVLLIVSWSKTSLSLDS